MDDIRVGCASWLDKSLVTEGNFYPKKSMSAEARLRWYADFFDFVEVNSSYYAIPARDTAQEWVERTPPHFRFGVKAWGAFTGHRVQALATPPEIRPALLNVKRNARGEIEGRDLPPAARDASFDVFRRAIDPLVSAGKLAYVLFQFAPWFQEGPETRKEIERLPKRLPGLPLAVEFRHPSWIPRQTEDSLKLLADNNLAHVAVDGPWMPRIARAPGPLFILRCHGRNAAGWKAQLAGKSPSVAEKYDYRYSEDEVGELAREFLDVKGENKPKVLVFNNNNRDYPVANALMAKQYLK